MLTCPGCLNGLAGMNAGGIAIAANIPYHENYFMERCPTGFLLREALRQSDSERKAVSFLEKAQPADHVAFDPSNLEFWLASAMPGQDKASGAGYQQARSLRLVRLLELDK